MNLLIGMLSGLALVLAAIPTLLTILNLRLFVRAPQPPSSAPLPQVSVLVPARNEEATIADVVTRSFAAFAELGCAGEVLVEGGAVAIALVRQQPRRYNCDRFSTGKPRRARASAAW